MIVLSLRLNVHCFFVNNESARAGTKIRAAKNAAIPSPTKKTKTTGHIHNDFESMPSLSVVNSEVRKSTLKLSDLEENITSARNQNCDEYLVRNLTDEVHCGEVKELREWAATSDIPHAKLDELLGILRKRLLPELPKSSKTFLKTSSAAYNLQKFDNRS